jgi:hemerythrin-like domain-containing protein
MSDDAIVLLREDHKELRRELREFARTREVNTAHRGEVCDRVVHLWKAHLDADNDVLYPAVRERVPDLLHEALTAGARNDLVARLVDELDHLEPYDEQVAPKMEVLAELTERHVEHDEDELFPRTREALGRNELQDLGRRIRSDRKDADQEPDDPVSQLVRSLMG